MYHIISLLHTLNETRNNNQFLKSTYNGANLIQTAAEIKGIAEIFVFCKHATNKRDKMLTILIKIKITNFDRTLA